MTLLIPSSTVNFFSRTTKDEYRAMRDLCLWTAEMQDVIESKVAEWHQEDQKGVEPAIMCIVNSSTPMSEVLEDDTIHWRWFYSLRRAVFDPEAFDTDDSGLAYLHGRTLNLWETGHSQNYAWGVSMFQPSDYPLGFSPQPVASGTTVMATLRGYYLHVQPPEEDELRPVYTIEAFGSHDGSCGPGSGVP